MALLLGQALVPFFYWLGINFTLFAVMDRLGVLALLFTLTLCLLRGSVRISPLIAMLLLYVVFISLVGMNGGVNIEQDQREGDIYIYLRFISFIILGYNVLYWKEIKYGYISILKIGILLNIFAILTENTFLRELIQGPTLAYQIQVLLMPSLFFIFYLKELSRLNKNVVILSFVVLSVEQLLFQKRLPLVRTFFVLALLSYVHTYWMIYGGTFGLVMKRYINYFIVGILGIFLVYIIGINLVDYINATVERFTATGQLTETLQTDARWQIGEIIIDDLKKSNDLITGRGLGGVTYDNSFHLKTTSGKNFRGAAEMGLPTILLKGGVVLLIILVILVLRTLSAYKYAKTHQFVFACWSMVLLWAIFVYAEGYIGSVRNINEFLLGYSFGFLLRVMKLKRRWPKLLARI